MAALPRGRTLPEEVWLRRHRWMTLLVWSQAIMLTTYGLLAGQAIPHSLLEGLPVAACALIAGRRQPPAARPHRRRGDRPAHVVRRARPSDGGPDRGALPLLRDGHDPRHLRGVVPVPDRESATWFCTTASPAASTPASVYDHADADRRSRGSGPACTRIFITALGAANIVGWRLNEEVRARRCAAARNASAAPSTRRRSAWRSSRPTGASCR